MHVNVAHWAFDYTFAAILFLTILMFDPLKYHNSSIWSARPCRVFSGFFQAAWLFFQGSFSTVQFPLCRISTTLHWSRYNSREWQPNGRLKPPSPVCLIAAGRHYVDLRLEFALSQTGDSGDSSREPAAPIKWLVNI